MASKNVVNLVRSLAHDSASSRLLRVDPEQLAVRHRLGPPAVAALRDVDRFFESEKPILQQSVRRRAAAIPAPPRPPLRDLTLNQALSASSDTGTLLPGPNTGTFSATSSGSGTALAPALPVPAAPAPAAPLAPAMPAAPLAPATAPPWPPYPPAAPIPAAQPIPAAPATPFVAPVPSAPLPYPFSPGWAPAGGPTPTLPPAIFAPAGGWPLPAPTMPAASGQNGCGCEAAVVAIMGLVSATAQTSITAIAAIAAKSRS
jgi:hypothetical protein